MKNIIIKSLVYAVAIITMSASCKKSSDNCKAGTGGTASLKVYFKHHSKLITAQSGYPDTLFIKYNTNDLPGELPSDYDTYFIGDTAVDHFMVNNLNCGKYYLFGTGWDPAISQRVKGGVPVTVDEGAGELSVNVPVTEDHN